MGTKDPRVDAYIAKAADFAKPILTHLRDSVHSACPHVEETLKWGMPYFMYKGVLCHMAAFKQHCAFGFWKGWQVVDHKGADGDAMGQFGPITSVADLPSPTNLRRYIKKAMALNEAGERSRGDPKAKRISTSPPEDLLAALKNSKQALAHFEAFSPTHKREYIEWITEAKRAQTRERRIQQAVEWIAEGKSRNWKHE